MDKTTSEKKCAPAMIRIHAIGKNNNQTKILPQILPPTKATPSKIKIIAPDASPEIKLQFCAH